MNLNYSKELKHAFVADGCELKKLTKLLQDSVGKVDIRVDCGDEFSLDFETIDELLRYENPPLKEIRRIHLRAKSDDYSNSATITLPGFAKKGVLIDLVGSESFVYTLREKTQDIIAGMRPWYDILARVSSVNVLYIIFLTVYPVARLANILMSQSDFTVEMRHRRFFVIGLLGLSILIFLGSKLCKYLFPRAFFTIGQGKSRYKHLQRVRKVIIGLLGFVISAAGTAIGIWQAIW